MFGANEPYRSRPIKILPCPFFSLSQGGKKKAYNHLFILRDPDAFPLRDLQVLQPAQHVVLHDEGGLHAELGALLDGEGFRLERLDGARGGQVDGHVGAAVDFEGERLDDAAALILGVYVDGRG